MSPAVNPFILLAERYGESPASTLATYADRPVEWVNDFVDFGEGEGLTGYQREILAALPRDLKVCVRSMHGAGKTAAVAMAVLWFATTRDAMGISWKCPTTAGAWRQLEHYLWPEIHHWAGKLRWDAMGRVPFTNRELLLQKLTLRFGSAFAFASNEPARIEGAHADSILFVFDEAKTISEATFDAAEGAFSGAGEALGLACSTPGSPIGRFYDIQSQKPGYTDWHAVRIPLDQALEAGRVSAQWIEQRRRQWGETSALYTNRVLGDFAPDDEEGIIKLAWVEAAVERWKANPDHAGPMTRLGVDVSRSGADETVIAPIYGHRVGPLRRSHHEDIMQTTGRVKGILDANPGVAVVIDTDGVGAGVTDRLREEGHTVEAFHASRATKKRDSSGELGFINVRAAAWWQLREMLCPRCRPRAPRRPGPLRGSCGAALESDLQLPPSGGVQS